MISDINIRDRNIFQQAADLVHVNQGKTLHSQAAADNRQSRLSIGVRAGIAISNGLVRFFNFVLERRSVARGATLLSEMDDRSLQDIGTTRTDIDRVSRHGRDRDRER